MTYEREIGSYTISDDPARFDLPRAHRWIAEESYWAKGIPYTTFAAAVRNSLTFGAFDKAGEMAAMARVVTDRATFGWLCDVFVDEAYRGSGLGKALMAYFKDHPDLQGFRRMHLATADAHGLYRQFGFGDLTGADRWMEIRDPDVYLRGR
ncbi:GNAT family N-acetyltransferase [Caulobacter mirabilis]|uniref:GNAT family N-acetyltransferase n=1 Tax=Caulobacter mirabilis TaxID=69666 RepID=A0A2D2ATQ7_9CAUL|nr:GNAT family N-acetyltransferase [Caulobacter mirabilis]ATQ41390.1 GNAT family N-acetyltransferase [Caulobacter mirabilis]